MNLKQQDLFEKALVFFGDDVNIKSKCCEDLLEDWVEFATRFRSSDPNSCCLTTMRSLLHFFVNELYEEDYIVKRNAVFGDLSQIRNEGFENRYLINIKLCKTYRSAYEKTELEYKETFNKRRYSSYDSFRQIRSRKMKKDSDQPI